MGGDWFWLHSRDAVAKKSPYMAHGGQAVPRSQFPVGSSWFLVGCVHGTQYTVHSGNLGGVFALTAHSSMLTARSPYTLYLVPYTPSNAYKPAYASSLMSLTHDFN